MFELYRRIATWVTYSSPVFPILSTVACCLLEHLTVVCFLLVDGTGN